MGDVASQNVNSSATSAFQDWWLKCPQDATLNFIPKFTGTEFRRRSDEEQTVFRAVGRKYPVVVRGVIQSETLHLPFTCDNNTDWDRLTKIRNSQRTLLLQRGYTNEQWYIDLVGDRPAVELAWDPTYKTVPMDANEVDRPPDV